jgi:hypothetical protein
MFFLQTVPGVVTAPVPKNADGSTAGTITAAHTTTGTVTEVSLTANSLSIPAHGYTTGAKVTELTTTGTLPAGLSTGTVYYVIKLDADTISLAASQANALAGTAVDITGYGTSAAVHTVVIATTLAGTLKLQKNNNPPDVTAVWVDLDDDEIVNDNNSLTISAAGNSNWVIANAGFREIRLVATITSGTVTADVRLHGKG